MKSQLLVQSFASTYECKTLRYKLMAMITIQIGVDLYTRLAIHYAADISHLELHKASSITFILLYQ